MQFAADVLRRPIRLYEPKRGAAAPSPVAGTATSREHALLPADVRIYNDVMCLAGSLPDFRSTDCKAIPYPPVSAMPKVSVIIIYYNEAMSTLYVPFYSILGGVVLR